MSKRRKKSKITLDHVLRKYDNGEFTKAVNLLSKAKIEPNEAGMVKQLKVDLNLQIAFENFCKHDYTSALKYSLSNRNIKPKEGYPISFEKHDILAGLSQLYLGNFEEAANYLQHAIERKETESFHFYYVLARLYKGDYEQTKTLATFNKEHKDYYKKISANRVHFLQAVFYLQKEKYAQMSQAIRKIVPKTHAQKVNTDALLEFLSKKKNIKSPSSVKPLYKVLTKNELSQEEYAYISLFPDVKEYYKKRKNSENALDFSTAVASLCDDGKPMPDDVLDRCVSFLMNKNDEKNLRYIIFNQYSAILAAENQDYEYKIIDLLNEYYKYLFQVPESIHLYLWTIEISEILIFIDDFFENIKLYFESNYSVLNKKELNHISFLILKAIKQQSHFGDMMMTARIVEKLNWKYNLLGFNLYLTCINFVEEKRDFFKYFKILAEHQFFHIFSDFIYKELSNAMHSIEDDYKRSLDFFNINPLDMDWVDDKQASLFIHKFLVPMTKAIIAPYKLHRKSKDLLNCYNIIDKYLFDYTILKQFPEDLLRKYLDSYKERIAFFKLDKGSNKYQDKINELESEFVLNSIQKTLTLRDDTPFIKIVDEHEKKGSIDVLVKAVEKYIDDYEVIYQFYPKMYYLFRFLYNKNEKQKIPTTLEIFKIYDIESTSLLNYALKSYKTNEDEKFVYDLFEFFEESIMDTCYMPSSYNLIIDFLVFLKKECKRNPDFEYSKALIKRLVDLLEDVLYEKHLKKVEKAIKDAVLFFKIDKNTEHVKILSYISKKDYVGLEVMYLRQFIVKNRAKEFQKFILDYTKNDIFNEHNLRLVFVLIKTYIEYRKISADETILLAKSIIGDNPRLLEFANRIKELYPKYHWFYFLCYREVIKPVLSKKHTKAGFKQIKPFLYSAINGKKYIRKKDKIVKIFILKCINYVRVLASKKNASKEITECYKDASENFADIIESQSKLF